MTLSQDEHFMRMALSLARRGLGRTAPNPAVACVLVQDGHVIARARTADGGRPHAETQALEIASERSKRATAYVTLEPCAHEGETPSCAKALVEGGVSRVVIACHDPDPRTAGQGIEILRNAGIEVEIGVLEKEAAELNAGFFMRLKAGRPFITLKTATSVDAMIAGGPQRWITGELSRARSHLLRTQHDAILVGIGTVLADDPMLTARVPGHSHEITRIVLDRNLRIPLDSKLVQSAKDAPLWVFHERDNLNQIEALEGAGVRLFGGSDVSQVCNTLAEQGMARLLIEGGAAVHTAFVRAELVDQFCWFRSPDEIGGGGISALNDMGIKDVVSAMQLSESIACGKDSLEIYTAKR